MASQVIPFPLTPARPSGRPLQRDEADRIARHLLAFSAPVDYMGALRGHGLSPEEIIEVGVSLAYIEDQRQHADSRHKAPVTRILDSDERTLWKMVQIARPETTLTAFLARRDEYSARLKEAERNVERRVAERRGCAKAAVPKAPKAKRQARQRLPSQDHN